MSVEEARSTPFALGLPGEAWVRERFAAIAEEARVRGVELHDPSAFLLLAQVGASLDDLREAGAESGAPSEAFHAFGLFLFHAFHLLGGGMPWGGAETSGAGGLLVELDPDTARALVAVEARVPSGWTGELPAEAGYLRLPRNLFWTRPGGEGSRPEALDGVSWVRCRGASERSDLALLAVSGIVGERPGFSVLPVPPVPLVEAGGWLHAPARAEGAGSDFAPTLPGGELGRLHSVETAGELLKLAARAMAWASAVPGSLVPEASTEEGARSAPDFRLRTTRLVLAGGGADSAP